VAIWLLEIAAVLGVSWEVANALEQLGIQVIGDWVNPPATDVVPAVQEDDQ
jgi:hypothetical protein